VEAELNDTLVKEEILKEIKDVLELNENEGTTYPNLWDIIKAVLRIKLLALIASRKKLERAHTSSLTVHLEALEQKEVNSLKRRRWQEIIKVRDKINQVETKEIYKESTKPGAGFL
jgi:RNAse (barnase) inhibitor barstar